MMSGVMLYEMLALRTLFMGSSTAELVRAIVMDELQPMQSLLPEHYSSDVKDIVMGLLVRDPLMRMTMAELLTRPLFRQKV